MDGTRLGLVTAKLMEKIEDVYGEDAEIVDALVLAEVTYPDGEGEEHHAVEFYCTDPRAIIREGLIAIAQKSNPFTTEHGDDYGSE